MSKADFWELLDRLVREEGPYVLFDLDMPEAKRGVLRISIASANSPQEGGIGIEDCARISKRISALNRVEQLYPEDVTLEVSSPGINRRLRRPEHFDGAVGERVKLKIVDSDNQRKSIRGLLEAFDGKLLTVKEDTEQNVRALSLSDVVEARVDFAFDERK